MTDPRPTLLIFTLGAAAERARRPLLPAAAGAAELALRQGCLDAAFAAGRDAGCRLEVSAPPPSPGTGSAPPSLPPGVHLAEQRGAGFGERLERACAAAAGRGAGPLVVVGTDVPGLAAAHLHRALAALAADPEAVVLGPSPDGGFYLLAAARPLPRLAARARWCRRDTLAALRRSLAADGRRVVLLPPLADLDRRRDLERWVAASRRAAAPRRAPLPALRRLLRRLAAVLAELRRPAAWRPPPRLRPAPVPVRRPRPPPGPR
jgi:uncharacterized protein